MLKVLVAAAIICAGSPVSAEPAEGQATAEQAKPAKQAKPHKICRETASSTSRIGVGKICRTETEWAEIDANAGSGNGRAVRSLGAENGK